MNISHGQSQMKKYFDGCQDNSTICMLKSIFKKIHDIKNLTAIWWYIFSRQLKYNTLSPFAKFLDPECDNM